MLFDVTTAPIVEPIVVPPPPRPPDPEEEALEEPLAPEPEPEPPAPEPPPPPEPEPPAPEPPPPPEPEPQPAPEPEAPEPAPTPPPAPPEPVAPLVSSQAPELTQAELAALLRPSRPATAKPPGPVAPRRSSSRPAIILITAAVIAAGLGGLLVLGAIAGLEEAAFGSPSPPDRGFATDPFGASGAPPPVVVGTAGTGILFDFDPDGDGPRDSEIYLLDPDSGEGGPLTENDVPDRWPRWSPDGTLIGFTRMVDGAGDIYVMDAQGGNERQLTSGADDDWAPDFSPNSFIVFNSDRNESDKRLHDIWGVDETGAGLGFLWGESGFDDRSPAWSPDGAWMAYTTTRDGDGRAIYGVDTNFNAQRVTFGGTVDRNPSWRPDSRGLVFARNADESGALRDIWAWDADTGAESQITTESADEGNPVYSPDGGRVVFYRRVDDAWHLILRDLASGDERDLTASLGGNSIDASWR